MINLVDEQTYRPVRSLSLEEMEAVSGGNPIAAFANAAMTFGEIAGYAVTQFAWAVAVSNLPPCK
jgi:hypothetical protein